MRKLSPPLAVVYLVAALVAALIAGCAQQTAPMPTQGNVAYRNCAADVYARNMTPAEYSLASSPPMPEGVRAMERLQPLVERTCGGMR